MTTALLQRLAAISAVIVMMVGCSPETASENVAQPAATASQDSGFQTEVIAALEAAARGEPFKDDLSMRWRLRQLPLIAIRSRLVTVAL